MADDDGDLWVSGRVDDMINTGGENMYPDEIEAALVRCPAVADVVVVGLPDERWGQAVTAFVVPAADVAPGEAVAATDAWARRILPSLQRPKRVVAVDAVPRSGGRQDAAPRARRRGLRRPRGHRRGRVMTWTPARDEDAALVSGAGRFLDDLDPLPGTLVAAVVRSPHPHARIRGVDLARARAHPGVAAVIGPEEVRAAVRPFPLSTSTPMPYLPSAVDNARYVGEPVAVVVAGDRYVAEDAAELVEVDYEPLDVVVDTRAALEPGARPAAPGGGHQRRHRPHVLVRRRSTRPSPRADHVVHGEYTFPRYSSVPMECYGVVGAVARRGRRAPPSRLGELPRAVHDGAGGGRVARRARPRGSGCTCRPTSAAASASSRASTPTSC